MSTQKGLVEAIDAWRRLTSSKAYITYIKVINLIYMLGI